MIAVASGSTLWITTTIHQTINEDWFAFIAFWTIVRKLVTVNWFWMIEKFLQFFQFTHGILINIQLVHPIKSLNSDMHWIYHYLVMGRGLCCINLSLYDCCLVWLLSDFDENIRPRFTVDVVISLLKRIYVVWILNSVVICSIVVVVSPEYFKYVARKSSIYSSGK